jgi:hypothetical protein
MQLFKCFDVFLGKIMGVAIDNLGFSHWVLTSLSVDVDKTGYTKFLDIDGT